MWQLTSPRSVASRPRGVADNLLRSSGGRALLVNCSGWLGGRPPEAERPSPQSTQRTRRHKEENGWMKPKKRQGRLAYSASACLCDLSGYSRFASSAFGPPNVNWLSCRPPAEASVQPATSFYPRASPVNCSRWLGTFTEKSRARCVDRLLRHLVGSARLTRSHFPTKLHDDQHRDRQ